MRKLTLFVFLVGLLISLHSASFGQRLTPAAANVRIKEATPAALPQKPKVAKARSDVNDLGLKGSVKSVITGTEEPDNSVTLRTEEAFDNSGALTTRISYDYQGNPWRVMVYGYIEGKRIAKDAVIHYDYDPPPMAVPPGTQRSNESPDTRYSLAYEYVYDTKGVLTEHRLFSNTGQLLTRTVYTYSGATIEKKSFNRDGKLSSQISETYDSRGNLIESSYQASNGYGPGISQYAYEKCDSQGNWTRRVVTGKTGRWGGTQSDFRRVDVRTITYHK